MKVIVHKNFNLVIGISNEKNLIIGYRYQFKYFISYIPKRNPNNVSRTSKNNTLNNNK